MDRLRDEGAGRQKTIDPEVRNVAQDPIIDRLRSHILGARAGDR